MQESSTSLSLEQQATNAETWAHIDQVNRFLAIMMIELMQRQFTHDRSKLKNPEVATFTEFTPKLATSTYGSEEYKSFLRQMKPALDHHYSHNRHHPEFFQNSPKDESAIAQCTDLIERLGEMAKYTLNPKDEQACLQAIELIRQHKTHLESNVNGMNLIDVLELICDWKAASMRHHDGDVRESIRINTTRFGLSPQLVSILSNTVMLLVDGFEHLKTQADL